MIRFTEDRLNLFETNVSIYHLLFGESHATYYTKHLHVPLIPFTVENDLETDEVLLTDTKARLAL